MMFLHSSSPEKPRLLHPRGPRVKHCLPAVAMGRHGDTHWMVNKGAGRGFRVALVWGVVVTRSTKVDRVAYAHTHAHKHTHPHAPK